MAFKMMDDLLVYKGVGCCPGLFLGRPYGPGFEPDGKKILAMRQTMFCLTGLKLGIAALAIISLAPIGAFQPALRAQQTSQASRSVWDGVYTEEQARRGEELYARECARCHGTELTGVEEAPPLAGPGFLSNWVGLAAGDLSERIRVSMPPNSPRRLSREKISDILARVFKANGFPAGSTEIAPETELLKQIRIEASKP